MTSAVYHTGMKITLAALVATLLLLLSDRFRSRTADA